MPFYASYRSIPELKEVPDAERREIWRRAFQKGWRAYPLNWVIAFTIIAVPVFTWWYVASGFGLSFWPRQLGAGILAGLTAGIVGHIATQKALPHIRADVASRSRGTYLFAQADG